MVEEERETVKGRIKGHPALAPRAFLVLFWSRLLIEHEIFRTPHEYHQSLPSTSPSTIATRPNLHLIEAFYYAITPCTRIASALSHGNAHPKLRVDKKNGTSSIEAQAAREPVSVQCGSCRKACGPQLIRAV